MLNGVINVLFRTNRYNTKAFVQSAAMSQMSWNNGTSVHDANGTIPVELEELFFIPTFVVLEIPTATLPSRFRPAPWCLTLTIPPPWPA